MGAIKIWAICLACSALPLQAQPYDYHWQAAMQAASARLRLFALMAQRPDGAGDAVAELQRGQGFAHQAPQILSSGLRLDPILRYDSNINGGTPGETILIVGLPFTIAPEQRAVSGIIWGAEIGASLRFSISPKTVVEAKASASSAHGASVKTATASLCLGQFLGRTDWLDLCLQRDTADRALSHNDQTTASIALSHQFATAFALSEAQVKLRQTVAQDYQKLSLDLGLTTARAQWGLLETRAEFGQYIAGEHTRLFGATLSLTRPIWGANTVVYASYAREGGADFFGHPRKDEVISLGLSRPINDLFGLNLSVQDRRSTLANYDGVTLGLNFTFRGLTF